MTKKREEPARATSKFDDKERSIEIAMAHYRKEQEAISQRTKELRELRLRHEAKHGSHKKQTGSRTAPTASGGSLSDWLEEQKKSGRQS